MMRSVCAMLLLLLAGCSPASDDSPAVEAAFQAYRQALLDQDGAAAWAVLDAHTRTYYDEIAQSALEIAREDLERLDIVSRLTVLRMRQEFRKAELEKMDGEIVFSTGVERGWISRSTVEQIALDRIESDGRLARAYIPSAPRVPVFQFLKESDGWKIALSQSFELANRGIADMAEKQDMPETEFIMAMLAQVSKFKVDERILDGPIE